MVIESDRDVQQRILAARRRELERLASHVPKGYADWSHNTSTAFKDAIKKVAKVRRNRAATLDQLNEAISSLEVFWS